MESVLRSDKLNDILLAQLLRSCDVCISDLDDTDCDSPAKMIVFDHMRSGRKFDPKFIYWSVKAGYDRYLNGGKEKESEIWKDYLETFLRSEKGIAQAMERFNEKRVRATLYSGVEEFYELLKMHKFYLTRNIAEVGRAYGVMLGFDGVLAEAFEKGKVLEEFVQRNKFRRYLVKGDSEDDEEMLGVLDFLMKKGKIDDYLSIYRADEPIEENYNPRFEINISKDYHGLVEILSKY